MTVSYSGNFGQLLLRWRGSLWKSLYKDLIVFLVLYYVINIVYRFALPEDAKVIFEKTAVMCNEYTKNIPLQFLLGFYVGLVVKRWWEQFEDIPWPDNFLYWISAYIRGNDVETVAIRRRVARYMILTAALALRSVSVRVLKRFPTVEHLQKAGLMTSSEKQLYEQLEMKHNPHGNWFLPLNWILTILMENFEGERRIQTSIELRQLVQEVESYRRGFDKIFIYDWISIPLLYTQLVTISSYGYFALCLIGRQYIRPQASIKEFEVDLYFPFFTILQFLFYIGWLKVGEDLLNPFGEDDEDFELNYLLDRHAEMAFLIVDMHGQSPNKDITALEAGDFKGMLHTRASLLTPDKPPKNHLIGFELSLKEQEVIRRQSQTDFINNHPVAFNNVVHNHNNNNLADLHHPVLNGTAMANGLGSQPSHSDPQQGHSNSFNSNSHRLLDRLKLPGSNSVGVVESTPPQLYSHSDHKF